MGPMRHMGLMGPSPEPISRMSPISPIRATLHASQTLEDEDDSLGELPFCHLSFVICHLSLLHAGAYHKRDF
jgi:hypothetical protein